MKLHTYMTERGLTDDAMAERLGCVTPQAVNRYRRGLRTPRRHVMDRLVEVTDGAVQPNDFFVQVAAE